MNAKCISILVAVTFVAPSLLSAKDYSVDKTVTISGTLSLDKDGIIRVANGDTVEGEAIKRIPVNADKRQEELKKLGASGKTAMLKGHFHILHNKAVESFNASYIFVVE
jgi:hypothetical protein